MIKNRNETDKNERQIRDFIAGASKQKRGRKPTGANSLIRTYSIDDETDKAIKRLTLMHRDFITTKSAVVKAGVAMLLTMQPDELTELLRKHTYFGDE